MTAFSRTQQGQLAFHDVAGGIARANRESRINQGIEIDLLEILANKCQSSMAAEVVGQFLDNKVGHLGLTFTGNSSWRLSA